MKTETLLNVFTENIKVSFKIEVNENQINDFVGRNSKEIDEEFDELDVGWVLGGVDEGLKEFLNGDIANSISHQIHQLSFSYLLQSK